MALLPRVALAALAGIALQAAATDPPSILVGSNVLASRVGAFSHVELTLAANPTNASNLIGAAITATRLDGGIATTVYASVDGGSSWIPTFLREPLVSGAADPQVAFNRKGTAYFATLVDTAHEDGRTAADLYMYRSSDGGLTWDKPTNIGGSCDHPMLVVNRSTGRYADHVYIGCLTADPEYRILVLRSDDEGHSFGKPTQAAKGGTLGINVVNVLVFSDGTLFVPYFDFDFRHPTNDTGSIWFVTSNDDARTFSSPQKILTRTYGTIPRRPLFHAFPVFAVDDSSTQFRDRIYLAWNDLRSGRSGVLFSYSADRGRTWSEPKQIQAPGDGASEQWQPTLAVNRDGIVGVTWFDTVGTDGKAFNEYFTASVDGGVSFLKPVRVSTETSMPYGAANVKPLPAEFRTQDSWRITLWSIGSRWANGGEYMGLAADAGGAFHPFWADARSGTFQAWTATVRVGTKADAVGSGPGSSAPVSLRSLVGLVYDPVSYDEHTGILEMPVRLKNHSSQYIFPPIEVEILRFGSGANSDINAANAPTILNASGGRTGVGARFDYSSALGDSASLAPGGQTAAVVWKMRVPDVLKIPNVHIEVTGRVKP